MSKVAVVFWSGTGNTEAMANAVGEGAGQAGAEVSVLPVSMVSADEAAGYDALALGCPAMGAEVLEGTEFEPFFTALEGKLSGKPVVLFGSYGWGDGQWMRDWEDRAKAAGAVLKAQPLMVNETPDDDALADCRTLGAAVVS